MPRLDGTGPEGKGPKTGRGLGDCDSKETVKTENPTTNADAPKNKNATRRPFGRIGRNFRDGTGPEGKGPRTGKGLGDCDPK